MIRTALRRSQRRAPAAAQHGFALPSVIIVLFVIILLTGAAIALSVQSSTSTTRDNNVKAELESAEAGLRVAVFRLNELEPSASQCIDEGSVQSAEGNCKDSSESLGNGATFSYWTTLPLKAGQTCAGRTVEEAAGVTQRCVTSQGTVNAVQPAVRLQARVASTDGKPLFPINGLFGSESVEIAPNATIKAPGGSNFKFRLNNNASVESVYLGKSAPETQPEVGKHASTGTVTRQSTDYVLNPVNTGSSATRNSNYRIENGLKNPPVAPSDESSSVSYNGATRNLEVGNNGTLTLGGKVYNFCNLTAALGATITVKEGVKTRIYIDSPNDPTSKCKPGDGKLLINNGSNILNPARDPSALQIYVYDGSGGIAEVSNNVEFYGTIYAPYSTVNMYNNAEVFGAIAAKAVNVKNQGIFSSDKRVEGLREPGGAYHRVVWEQCTRGSGASEGC
jgi:Tfp pilus assembly protein PilX